MFLKLDIKTLLIIVLTFFFIITIVFLCRKDTNDNFYQEEINRLTENNKHLSVTNDSLLNINKEIDYKLNELETLLVEYEIKLTESELQIDNLTKRRNEIPIYVNNLSANDIANEFSDFIRRKKYSTSSGN